MDPNRLYSKVRKKPGQSGCIIIPGQIFASIALIIVCLFFPIIVNAQITKEISLSTYPGFTIVNYEKALGYPNDFLTDNDHIQISAAVRGFLLSEKQIQFGAEVAWQKLYYAYYVVPNGTTPFDQEFKVKTFSLMILGRQFIKKIFFIGGAGIHFFNSGVSPALCLESGYMLSAGEKVQIPLSFRITPIFRSATVLPISVGAGLCYRFR